MSLKKFIVSGLVAISVLAGCAQPKQENTTTTTNTANTEESMQRDDSSIIVYFSPSGTTEGIANDIAQITGAQLYQIEPSNPYTSDDLNWNNQNSRVVKEYEDSSLQDVAIANLDVPNWDQYSTVYIGYPIWWRDASWVVKSFVRQTDFTGKTVIPFATSMSSPVGDSGKNLEALAQTGTWLEGERFSRSSTKEDVQAWLDGINR